MLGHYLNEMNSQNFFGYIMKKSLLEKLYSLYIVTGPGTRSKIKFNYRNIITATIKLIVIVFYILSSHLTASLLKVEFVGGLFIYSIYSTHC